MAASDPSQADQPAINLFHPIYHSFTYPVGCRIDIDRSLPVDLHDEDSEELIDNFSEPPVWVERFSPVAVQIGDQVVRGKNASDLMLRVYRVMFDLFHGLGRFIESSINQSAEGGAHFPFMSLCVDPDTLHRLIESDYESGDTAYPNLMRLFSEGKIAPCLTTPFHAILPMLASEAEMRLCIRSGLILYLRIIRNYSDFLAKNGEGGLMVMPVWLPEGGYSQKILQILRQEFDEVCKKEKLGRGHLVLMLDNQQAEFAENDVLMKSWNQLEVEPAQGDSAPKSKRVRDSLKGLHEGVGNVTVLFRDRAFSDWVIHANPSVKKLLDRTIAKVDSDINMQNVHYGWAHFEELEAITYSPRAIVNFQQKLVKLTELGYLPLSPDFYTRGKLRGEFGCTTHEPQKVNVLEGSVGNNWDLEQPMDFSRWLGHRNGTSGHAPQVVSRPYERTLEEGKAAEPGNQAWKIAWAKVREKCYHAIVGDLETLKGGMAEVLAGLSKQKEAAKQAKCVQDFLAHYTYVYWREHFIQHDMAEADINILELTTVYLRAGVKAQPSETDAAIAGAAAQAIYFALDSARSIGHGCENMDQRAFYQNVVMLTLAFCNAIYLYHWMGDKKAANKLLSLLKQELIDFEGAFDRYNLGDYGVSKTAWKRVLKSEVADSKDNVVKRAAVRIAARHLRPLGYTKDFTRQDANVTTNVGHMWSTESERENFRYENPLFCGVSEE